MHAPPKPAYPVFTDVSKLTEFDAFLFGIPTRYGNFRPNGRCVSSTPSSPSPNSTLTVCASLLPLRARIYTGILGPDWRPLGLRCSRQEVRWCVREHGVPRRRSGIDRLQRHLHPHPPTASSLFPSATRIPSASSQTSQRYTAARPGARARSLELTAAGNPPPSSSRSRKSRARSSMSTSQR